MEICCTKKLLNEMDINSQIGSEENDLFCWSAHLISVNRRKTVVVVNDSNRFGFILHGLKAKDFKNFGELITLGIRDCLRDEKIKEEIIEKYLKTADAVTFTRTRGPRYVARLNKACERVDIFDDRLDPSRLFQTVANSYLNNDLIKINKEEDYEYPHVLLYRDFEQFSHETLLCCEAIDLTVKLDLELYTAWRRIIVPADIYFKKLHEILQVAFNWKSYHLYDFNIIDHKGKCVLKVIDQIDEDYEPWQDCETSLSSDVRLLDHFKPGYRIVYTYDFGDNWEHEILINRVISDYDKNYPICLRGEGNAPPEDVGGVTGYKHFLEIMADPNHEEYEDTFRWGKSQGYKDFDMDSVNRRLKNILRRW